ncbi:MAG: hybrid sensor histidine kinase/response regulator [Ignavibacteriae bacterium]|nr:hybrid sensor histidine kinase/response regulator [Ignavibacteriota bacterium]NOG97187.1 hybrid sensor histidine kinase/response regulator [Ignavibacteriota bacterium]
MNIEPVRNSTILIVDDSAANLGFLRDYLLMYKFKVLIAQDGQTALDLITQGERPDLVMLDIMMPGMDGFEVCKRLKENEATVDVPVIFLSVLSEAADRLRGFEIGAVDYIDKPFQKEEVLARVTAQLTIRKQQQDLRREIKERTQAEKQLQKYTEELKELNASKDKFFSIIAHDLKSPFTALLGFADYLTSQLDELSKDEVRECSTNIYKSAQGVFNLLENLLHWSSMQTGRIEFAPMSFNLNKLIDETFILYQVNAFKKKITLVNEMNASVEVYADRKMVETILRNLISNAIKYTPAGGEVGISAKPNEEKVEIAVSDTGVGISTEQMAALFKIDEDQNGIGPNKEMGTGIGLILCKEFVNKNNGKIWVESKMGEGSKFIFSLPVIKIENNWRTTKLNKTF